MARKNGGSPNYRCFSDVETVVVPVEDRGQLRSNDYGPFFARSWSDGTFSCVSEDLERRLIDIGIKAGIPVGIRKASYNRSVIWHVRLLGASTVSPPKQHTNGHATPADVTWANLPSEKYAPVPASNGHTPHTLEDQLRASIAAVQAVDALREPKNLLERAAQAAVDCAIFAETYAAKQGKLIQIPPESIAAWASTLFINARSHS